MTTIVDSEHRRKMTACQETSLAEAKGCDPWHSIETSKHISGIVNIQQNHKHPLNMRQIRNKSTAWIKALLQPYTQRTKGLLTHQLKYYKYSWSLKLPTGKTTYTKKWKFIQEGAQMQANGICEQQQKEQKQSERGWRGVVTKERKS